MKRKNGQEDGIYPLLSVLLYYNEGKTILPQEQA